MTEEEDKWWSPGHVDTEDDVTPPQSATEDSSNEEIVGRENIDKFMDQIRDSESGSKELRSEIIAREDAAPSPQPPASSLSRSTQPIDQASAFSPSRAPAEPLGWAAVKEGTATRDPCW